MKTYFTNIKEVTVNIQNTRQSKNGLDFINLKVNKRNQILTNF